MRDIEGSEFLPSPRKRRNSLVMKLLRVLKSCGGMMKCSSPLWVASGWRQRWRANQFSLGDLVTKGLIMLQCVHEKHELDFLFLLEVVRGSEGGPGTEEKWVWSEYIIWNPQIINKRILIFFKWGPFNCWAQTEASELPPGGSTTPRAAPRMSLMSVWCPLNPEEGGSHRTRVPDCCEWPHDRN